MKMKMNKSLLCPSTCKHIMITINSTKKGKKKDTKVFISCDSSDKIFKIRNIKYIVSGI